LSAEPKKSIACSVDAIAAMYQTIDELFSRIACDALAARTRVPGRG
jgi:hypothetical protein